jgi:hypothetical protein
MKTPRQSPLKQIRSQCLDCCGGSVKMVRYCSGVDCPLWHLRFGKSPKRIVKELGEEAEALFEKANFVAGGKFSPEKNL